MSSFTLFNSCFVYISSIIFIQFYFCENITAIESPNYKLPSAIFPTKYHLHITTHIHRDILPYNGSVSIDFTVRNSTNEIVLNSKNLTLVNITLMNFDSGMFLEKSQLNYELDERKEQLRIDWPSLPLEMKIGQQYRLKIYFTGKIEDKELFGFYKSTYLDSNNNSVSLAMTYFEPTGARFAFPCFDEPAYKAKFLISITHGNNYSAISNMPADGEPVLSSPSSANEEEMITTKFLETPLMSTYLVAFVVSNYDKITSKVNGLEYRFFFPPNSKNDGLQALNIATTAIDNFSKLLGIKYTLPKLDQFQTRKLFPAAMENWGLMTFHRSHIASNYKMPHSIDAIITLNHEIAHQWFGNLVTPEFWDYIWMKEGTSTYFSYIATYMLYPDMKVFDYFLMTELPELFSAPLDRPLTSKVKEGATDIKEYFDVVPYTLGAGVVRMFHHAIGDSTFMKGIFKYLLIFQYSVADEDDFFMAIQAAIDEDNVSLFQNNQSVANVMKTWTHNVGFPIIKIIRNYENGTITIRQKSASGNQDQKWWIPMSFATKTKPNFDRTIADYIMPPQAEVMLDLKDLNINLSNSDWLIVNKQQTGIFWVVYDDLNLKMISKALNCDRKSIHPYNRALIFRDIILTIKEELYSVEQLIELLEYLYFEKEHLPWFNGADLIVKLLSILDECEASDKFKLFINKISFWKLDELHNDKNEKLLTDLKLKAKIMAIRFKVDTKECQNDTTESAKEYFITDGVIETHHMPCKLSLCQAIQNAKYHELKSYLNRTVVEFTEMYKFHELDNLLECVVSDEIFEEIWRIYNDTQNTDLSDRIFTHAILLNKFFKTWAFKYHKTEMEELDVPVNEIERRKSETLSIHYKEYCTLFNLFL